MLQGCTGSVYRTAVSLALAYWRSGCLPLATDEVTLAALSRAPVAHFRNVKAEALAAFYSMQPDLDETHAALMQTHRSRLTQIQNMTQIRRTQLAAQASERTSKHAAKAMQPLPTRADAPREVDAATAHAAMNGLTHDAHNAQTSGNVASRPVRGPFKPGVTTFTD